LIHKDNRVYIRTAMPFGTRLNLKPFEVFEVHFPTKSNTDRSKPMGRPRKTP
jgi:hypothetical protein